MIDDHPLNLEGYKKVLLDNRSKDLNLIIDTANSCDEADEKLEQFEHGRFYDLVFLDIGLPPSSDGKLLSGEDLGKKIKESCPDSKLIVLTMFNESVRLLSILKSLNPEGFLIKSDVTPVEFLQAFDHVINGKRYSSHTVNEVMRQQLTNDFDLDKTDREILLRLSEGVKTKELPNLIPISLTAIEKRKKAMREILEVEDVRDISLINKARKLGFI